MLRWFVFALTLAVARAAVLQKPGELSPLGSKAHKRTPKVDSLDSINFGAEVFDSPAEAPLKRSPGWDYDSSSDSDSDSDSIEHVGHYQKRPEVSNLDNRVIKRSLRPSSVKRRLIRSLGVMENAGLGALNSAVSTFSNTVTSANVASGLAAGAGQYRPGYPRPGYPRPGYPRPGYPRPVYPRPGYSQGYQQGYQEWNDYDFPYEGGTYPGNRGTPVRGTNLSSNVNNIKIVSAH